MTGQTIMWVCVVFWLLGGLTVLIPVVSKDMRMGILFLLISLLIGAIVAYNLGLIGGHTFKLGAI
jgi:uncharacterized membrane protein